MLSQLVASKLLHRYKVGALCKEQIEVKCSAVMVDKGCSAVLLSIPRAISSIILE